MLQHLDIFRDRRARQALLVGRLRERGRKRAKGREVERSVAPLQHLDGIEGVALERLHQFRLERRAATGGSKRAVAHGAAGAAGDLPELTGVELAKLVAVELAVG